MEQLSVLLLTYLMCRLHLRLFLCFFFFFFLMIRRPPRSTLFPYTTSSDLRGLDRPGLVPRPDRPGRPLRRRRVDQDRKSTRLNSSHTVISYAVFCLKKKKKKTLFPYILNSD